MIKLRVVPLRNHEWNYRSSLSKSLRFRGEPIHSRHYCPLQSNGICLEELTVQECVSPNTSTLHTVDFPQVTI